MKLRVYILIFLLIFGLLPLILAVAINLPLVLERTTLFYQRAYLQNLRADFRDLDQHLASRHEMVRLLAKLPEPGPLPGAAADPDQDTMARARYTEWINQILDDQFDIVRILFVGKDGATGLSLVRDPRLQDWREPSRAARPPNPQFLAAGLEFQPGAVLVGRIRIDPAAGAEDPRQFMTLDLISPIGGGPAGEPRGAVVMTIDVGGLAQFYRDTLWINQDGSYLRPSQAAADPPDAFAQFPGLADLLAQGTLAVWKDRQGRQMLWVPMFLTEDGGQLWVGRPVDPSPIDAFRDALIVRVLTIILVLVLAVMVLARGIAARAERFGKALTGGIGSILRGGAPQSFEWRGPREIRELGVQLTALAHTHAEHLRAAQAHTRELEKSNRYKSEFLANVSHELRTPLNSILLLSKMLAAETGGLSPPQRRQAQVIHDAGRDLRTMIDNILDISRIEAGHVSLFLEWIEPAPMLDELVELIRPLLDDKPVTLRLDIAAAAPARIRTDRDKLRQILKNFLANAAKFTERGEIVLGFATSDDPERPACFSVADTGIGIPGDKQAIIFEAFQQADGSTRRRYGGTGLGLSISRELATLLDGRIAVESAPGAGARFSLRLPLNLSADLAGTGAAVPTGPASAVGSPPIGGMSAAPDPPAMIIASPGPSRESGHAPAIPAIGNGGSAPDRGASSRSAPGAPTDLDASAAKDIARVPANGPPSPAASDGRWALIVARDVPTLAQLAAACARRGLSVQNAADPEEALETLQDDSAGCVLILLADGVPDGRTCDTIRLLLQHIQGIPPLIAVLTDTPESLPMPSCPSAPRIEIMTRPIGDDRLAALLSALPVPASPGAARPTRPSPEAVSAPAAPPPPSARRIPTR